MNKTENLSPERAVEILNNITFYFCREATKMGVEAIERCMIAKKPDYEADGYDEDGELVYNTALCPNCGVEIDDFEKSSYCSRCGQKLDWSEVE